MAQDADGEDSVLFSLKELKRVASEASPGGAGSARAPAAAAPAASQTSAMPAARSNAPAARSVKATDPNDEDAGAVLSASLSTLRGRVEDDRRRAEELQRMLDEEQRLLQEQEALASNLEAKTNERSRFAADRAAASERVAKARAEGKRIEEAELARAGLTAEPEAPPRRGIFLSPVAAALLCVVIVGALGGLGWYAFGRKPIVRTVTVAGVPSSAGRAATPSADPEFGAEIGWLAVGDVAAPPAQVATAEEEEEDTPRRTRRARRRRASGTSTDAAGEERAKPRVVLPPKPTGNGFVY